MTYMNYGEPYAHNKCAYNNPWYYPLQSVLLSL